MESRPELRTDHPVKLLLLHLVLFISICSHAADTGTQISIAGEPASKNDSATTPTPRSQEYEWMSIAKWYRMHADDVEVARKGEAKVVLLGDSITESWQWEGGYTEVFDKYFGSMKVANFGIGGDQTQNLLWRLQHGLKGELTPAVVVLLIGVNNFGHSNHSAEQVASGVRRVVEQIHNNYPDAHIILNGILPYQEKQDHPDRARVKNTNALISQLARLDYVDYYDFGNIFLNASGDIDKSVMYDYLHPTAEGMTLFAEKLKPLILDELNRENRRSAWIMATDPKIQIEGRYAHSGQGRTLIGYPGVALHFNARAKKISLLAQTSGETFFDVMLDDQYFHTIKISNSPKKIALYEATNATAHKISLVNRSETWQGVTTVMGLELREGELMPAPALPERKILIIGDSITCGEGVHREPPEEPNSQCDKSPLWWSPRETYGMALANHFNAQVHLVCYGGRGLVRSWNGRTDELNAPDFYQLAIAEPSRSMPWDNKQYQADLIFAALGTNDFSDSAGALPAKNDYVKTYANFINRLIQDHPKARIILTDGPMVNNDNPAKPSKSLLLEYLYATQKRVNRRQVHVIPSRPYRADQCDAHPPMHVHQEMAKDFEPLIRNIMGWR